VCCGCWLAFLLGSVALQWLRGLVKRSLWRCTSEIGFIGRILQYNFYRLPFTPPPLWFAVSVLHLPNPRNQENNLTVTVSSSDRWTPSFSVPRWYDVVASPCHLFSRGHDHVAETSRADHYQAPCGHCRIAPLVPTSVGWDECCVSVEV
jgi:hypothetical protein